MENGRDGKYTHPFGSEFPRGLYSYRGYGAFRCNIGTLSDLALESCYLGGVDDDATLAVRRQRLHRHDACRRLGHDAHRAQQINGNNLRKALHVHRAVTADEPHRAGKAGAIDEDPRGAERLRGGVERGNHR